MHICVSGLTAAGKTTHSTMLAQDLGYEYVSATSILARLCGLRPQDSLWFSDRAVISALRDAKEIDHELDAELRALARDTQVPRVFDAWALPWLWEGPMVRVWLESTLATRIIKCKVSQLDSYANQPWTFFGELVTSKDRESQRRFLSMYGFDLFVDHEIFDVVIDNSSYISEATRAASDRGIHNFHPVFLDSIRSRLGMR